MYLNLVTPASKVSEGLDGHANVCLEGQRVHSSRVDGLDGGQLLLVFLHQVCQPGEREGCRWDRTDCEDVFKNFYTTILLA